MVREVEIYQLKIRLLGISPMIWRRVLVPSDISLRALHGVIQVAMGWEGIHLFQFDLHSVYYGSIELHLQNPKKALGEFELRENDRFSYVYDMGDYWEHEIRVENILAPGAHKSLPICTGGSGDCPPEDCGGVDGYLERRDEAHGYEAWQDMHEMIDWLDRINNEESAQKRISDLLHGDAELAIKRMAARSRFFKNEYSRKSINKAFRDGVHLELMHQQY